jgi:hypothetical protein
MVLAAASCWVQPASERRSQQKIYLPLNGGVNWKGFVNDFKSDSAHFFVFVKKRVLF